MLCYLGYSSDGRITKTFKHLLQIQHTDGGWRCNTYKYGRGPEAVYSNPGPTLFVLDAFRFTDIINQDQRLDAAVEFLLNHWETRLPLGPCRYGIGTLFMKVEYPFFRYNLFYYLYVLSFYDKVKKDPRYTEALRVLQLKLVDDKLVVENPHRKLSDFSFCKRGEPSDLATRRYQELLNNLNQQ